MKNLDEGIKKALAGGEGACDLDGEAGILEQLAGIFRGKMRWAAVFVCVESVVFVVLIVFAVMEFFKTDSIRWQIFHATGVVVLSLMLVLIKVWSWMQMNRYAIQREIKRIELRVLELGAKDEE